MTFKAGPPVYGGYVLCREEGVVFVKGAIPGEVVEADVVEKKKDYSVAEVTKVIEPSADRVEPGCRYFGVCGGCQLQFASYEKQVSMKQEVFLDCLRRIGGYEPPRQGGIEMPPLSGIQWGYRHRAQFKVSKEGEVGFFKEDSRDVVPIDSCPLMVREINEAIPKIKALDLSGIKEIHITSGDCLIALIKGRGFDAALSEGFMTAGFSGVAFGDGSRAGKGYASFDLLGLTYTVSPWSFFQSNRKLNTEAVRLVLEGLRLLGGKKVVDLYAGAGNFSLPVAKETEEVIAYEENPHAVKDGERNARLNDLKNVKFVSRPAEKASFKADVGLRAPSISVIADPPRPGLSEGVIRGLLDASPEQIVYVSCNPATLARDLKRLSGSYGIVSTRVMDFFPQTYHVESLTFLGALKA